MCVCVYFCLLRASIIDSENVSVLRSAKNNSVGGQEARGEGIGGSGRGRNIFGFEYRDIGPHVHESNGSVLGRAASNVAVSSRLPWICFLGREEIILMN